MVERILVGVCAAPNVWLEEERRMRLASLHINFKLTYLTKSREILQSRDGELSILLDEWAGDRQVLSGIWVDSRLFKNTGALAKAFSPSFSILGIDSSFHKAIVAEIVAQGYEILSRVSCRRLILPLNLTILRECDIVVWAESELIDTAFSLSSVEFETLNNYGMIPAAPQATMLLKPVKVQKEGTANNIGRKRKGGESSTSDNNCSICLEDFSEFETSLPCNHMFHRDCILKWLKRSRYCPLCRFEIPTSTSTSSH